MYAFVLPTQFHHHSSKRFEQCSLQRCCRKQQPQRPSRIYRVQRPASRKLLTAVGMVHQHNPTDAGEVLRRAAYGKEAYQNIREKVGQCARNETGGTSGAGISPLQTKSSIQEGRRTLCYHGLAYRAALMMDFRQASVIHQSISKQASESLIHSCYYILATSANTILTSYNCCMCQRVFKNLLTEEEEIPLKNSAIRFIKCSATKNFFDSRALCTLFLFCVGHSPMYFYLCIFPNVINSVNQL